MSAIGPKCAADSACASSDDRIGLLGWTPKYSCLATFDPVHSFEPLWQPRFISKLAPEDRCHLNGFRNI